MDGSQLARGLFACLQAAVPAVLRALGIAAHEDLYVCTADPQTAGCVPLHVFPVAVPPAPLGLFAFSRHDQFCALLEPDTDDDDEKGAEPAAKRARRESGTQPGAESKSAAEAKSVTATTASMDTSADGDSSSAERKDPAESVLERSFSRGVRIVFCSPMLLRPQSLCPPVLEYRLDRGLGLKAQDLTVICAEEGPPANRRARERVHHGGRAPCSMRRRSSRCTTAAAAGRCHLQKAQARG
jgi:hypothetical protein